MKTLVILLNQTRGYEITYENIKKNLIDELNADLCLCIGAKSDYNYDNPFYKLAKYKFIYDESSDPNFINMLDDAYNKVISKHNFKYEKLENMNSLYRRVENTDHHCDNINYIGDFKELNENFLNTLDSDEIVYHQKALNSRWGTKLFTIKNGSHFYVEENNVVTYKKHLHYKEFINIKHHLWNESTDKNSFSYFLISTGIHILFLWFLQDNLKKNNLIQEYDRFVITRSDYLYTLPHPKMELLNSDNIWIPDEEDYGGICDRHVVLSKTNFEKYVNILECFFVKSNYYYRSISKSHNWNMERILKFHLESNNIFNKVRRFPYVMYLVRDKSNSITWSPGVWFEEFQYYVKYISEYKKAKMYNEMFKESRINLNSFYIKYINK
jgi:hypothetical protein